MSATPSRVGPRRRTDEVRENGMRSVGRVTRWALAVSLALTAALSALADIAFPGHSSAATGRGTSSTTAEGIAPSGGVRVALPPRGGVGGLTPPATEPVQPVVPVGPVTTSGGS